MSVVLRDVRFGLQGLIRSPGFTLVSVVTLALGIGMTSAQFSIVSGTLLNSLPWKDPETLVAILERHRLSPGNPRGVASSKYIEWREQVRSFTELGAAHMGGVNLTDDNRLDHVESAHVTPSSFQVVGTRPLLGRNLIDADAAPDAPPVAILTEGLWMRRYGSDPAIIGRTIEIDDVPVTVVGVQAAAQWFPWPWIQIITPLRFDPAKVSRTDHQLTVYGRLLDGVTMRQAQAEMDVIAAAMAQQYPETDRDWGSQVVLMRDQIVEGPTRTGIWIMMGAVGFVLLIACANVANLLLARAATRQKEMAIRSALGATRPQIVLQLLTEAALLALVALPFALLMTNWTIQGLLSQVPPSVTYMEQFFRFDPPVWIFCAVITLSTVVFFGLAPALQASGPDLSTSLKEGGERGSSHGRQRLRLGLVVGQIALALALLVSSGLMIESFMNLQTADPGFETANLVVTQLNLSEARYTEPDHHRAFQRDVLQRIGRLPGVVDVGTTQNAPFGFGGRGVEFRVRGGAQPTEAEIPLANWANVSPNYHALMGIPLVRGRALEQGDGEGGRAVIVINETLARRYFVDEDPIGEHLIFELDDGEEIEHEIVGVARDIINWGFNEEKWPLIYAPFVQAPTAFMNVIVRTRGAPLKEVPSLRAEFASIDPNLALFQFESMTDRMQRSKWQQRLFAVLMVALGMLALVLASVGVYGVVSYSTARRTREFGIRSALGAAPSGIAGLVLREALVLAGLGLALGALLGAGMARVLQALLYEISPWRPLTFLTVALLLAAVALVASAVPARRATRVDPMIALRVE